MINFVTERDMGNLEELKEFFYNTKIEGNATEYS